MVGGLGGECNEHPPDSVSVAGVQGGKAKPSPLDGGLRGQALRSPLSILTRDIAMTTIYICKALANNHCLEWIEVSAPILEKGDGLEIGLMFLGVTILAWGIKQIIKLLLSEGKL